MENNKTDLPVTKVGRVGIRLLETKNGVSYQFRLVVPTELRKDGKREKTKIWINKENLKGKALRIKLENEAIEFEKSILQNSQGNPLDETEKPKVEEKEFFTMNEIKNIISILDSEVAQGKTSCKWQAVMYLLIFTGARRGEIMGLSWDSIDFNKGLMTIKQATSYSHERKEVYIHTPKTKQSIRTIMLNARVLNILREYKKEYLQIKSKATKWVDAGLLFVQPDGRPISPGAIDDWMQSFAQRNELAHMNPHKFRHSAATNMLQSNQIDLKSASVMLGHSTPSVTANIYAHALKDNNARACGVLADVYAEEKK